MKKRVRRARRARKARKWKTSKSASFLRSCVCYDALLLQNCITALWVAISSVGTFLRTRRFERPLDEKPSARDVRFTSASAHDSEAKG